MSLSFSNKVKSVVPEFKAYRNSIDIYTEDKSNDNKFYRNLFARILDGTSVQIEDVYPLGDCDVVCKKCKDATMRYNQWQRPRLYMIDGDIYLMYSPKAQPSHMYVLNTYCIENKLICEDAVALAISGLLATIEPDDVKRIIQFNNMLSPIIEPIMSLYYHMALSKEQIGVFKLYNIEHFYDFSNNRLKAEEIKNCVEDIKSDITSKTGMSPEEIDKKIKDIQTKIQPTQTNFFKYVSGKDYILPFVIKRSLRQLKQKHSISFQLPKDSWKCHLVNYCDLEQFNDLKDAILNECNLFELSHQKL
jgi:hypothetical protein